MSTSIRSYWVLAPRARWRSQVVRYARGAPNGIALTLEATPHPAGLTQAWTWAALMRRVFALDVLACPRCDGRLRVIATIQDPAVVRAFLAHLGLAPAAPAPARSHCGHRITPGGTAGLSERVPINDGAGRQGSRLPRSRAP